MKRKNMSRKAREAFDLKCFQGRKNSIKKKTRELSVLCDVKACAVIIGPDGKLETWPENSADVLEVFRQFQNSGGRSRPAVAASVGIEEKDGNFGRTSPEKPAGVLDVIRQLQIPGVRKPRSVRTEVVSEEREQRTAASVGIEEKDESFEHFLKDVKEEAKEEPSNHHVPNVSEFDEWVNSNWSDRTLVEPKQEKGYLQLLLEDDDVDDEVVIPTDPSS